MTTATLTAGIGQATTMYALDDLTSALCDALTDAASFRKPAFTDGNDDAEWAAHHAALDVVTVRKAGTVTAADGYMLHEIRLNPADVAPLLVDEKEATYWVHGTHAVRAPITPIDHASVCDPTIQGIARPYHVTLHPDHTTDDNRLFMEWLYNVVSRDHGFVLRGSLDKEGDAFAGTVSVSHLPNHESPAWAWETATSPWSTDAAEPRPWLIVVNAHWLYRLVDLRRGDGPIEIYLPAGAPAGPNVGRAEEGMVFVRGTHSTGVLMPMAVSCEEVAAMERNSADEEVTA